MAMLGEILRSRIPQAEAPRPTRAQRRRQAGLAERHAALLAARRLNAQLDEWDDEAASDRVFFESVRSYRRYCAHFGVPVDAGEVARLEQEEKAQAAWRARRAVLGDDEQDEDEEDDAWSGV